MKYLIPIILLIVIIPLFVGPFAFIGAIFYPRSTITALAVKINMPSLCFFVTPSDHCEESFPCALPALCYYDVAVKTKNPRACDKINTKYYLDKREACYIDSGESPKVSAKKCDDVSEDWEKGGCYGFFAINLNDSSVCGETQNSESRAVCYLTYIQKAKNVDVNICEKEASPSFDQIYGTNYPGIWKNACYVYLATSLKNSSICFKITKSSEISGCLDSVQKLNQIK